MAKLLIGTYFKRPKAPIDLPNGDGTFKRYFFTPIDPLNPDSEHVCEIENPKHQQTLLAIAEGYYLSEAQTAAQAAQVASAQVGRPPVPPAPPAPPPPPPAAKPAEDPRDTAPPVSTPEPAPEPTLDQADTPAPTFSSPTTAAAAGLLDLKLSELKAALKTADRAVVGEALAIEVAKSETEQRPTFVKALQAALSS